MIAGQGLGMELRGWVTRGMRKRPTLDRMFASTSPRNDDGLRASYNISLLIAKSGKPHTIGEKLILPAVEEVLKTVVHKPASDIIKRIPLSNNTVERRIDEMSSDLESFVCSYLQTTHFSIQLDESTLPDNAALLLAYVRFIMNQEIYEELLFARTLITDTKDSSESIPTFFGSIKAPALSTSLHGSMVKSAESVSALPNRSNVSGISGVFSSAVLILSLMPNVYVRKNFNNRGSWTEDNLKNAMAAVNDGLMSVIRASLSFQIPRKTL
ncbi:unnamed protein product [Acanthoscelides obtectus]|uniref:Zinc finger BED domain-containing protein 5 n=1 Tax=Acanthoscelides obtectus TaxID=200917 RepID=A0A9P0MLN2_ACAOB|nr:unnamed protein product [Acanthoscelides obtectus]CAK1687949.1 SCAN domain-containing protein 3 [Acanthoscelides obtectus]